MTNADSLTQDFSTKDHLSNELLVRMLDDELSGSEAVLAESHLAQCERCRERYQELHLISVKVESAVTGFMADDSHEDRRILAERLDLREHQNRVPVSRRFVSRLRWGMAIAATLAIGILFLPEWKHPKKSTQISGSNLQLNLEVDGESFVSLPYSNPDLPVSASHIVQMRVPVSSLADAGIVFEPISSQASRPDDSVLADILFGVDGQPRGVHVLSAE